MHEKLATLQALGNADTVVLLLDKNLRGKESIKVRLAAGYHC